MNTTTSKLGPSFRWHNATQFLGALNDNVFKLLLIFFLVDPNDPEQAMSVQTIAAWVFVIPFLLFTAFAGNLADRFSKRNIIVSAKAVELLAMIGGCVAFMFDSAVGVYSVLFVMATQSAFFGPSKYGIVPELVRDEQLSKANSFLEALTYLSIVIGTATAPFLAQITNERYVLTGLVCVAISVAGIISSLQIHRTPPAGTGRKASILFVRDVWHTLRMYRSTSYHTVWRYLNSHRFTAGTCFWLSL
jgi:acyl-[acyl-carrier-protein]-phospholipid O-acyltransferase/long-chain-fatty-acid--[acyl-carrier-protein] ligase